MKKIFLSIVSILILAGCGSSSSGGDTGNVMGVVYDMNGAVVPGVTVSATGTTSTTTTATDGYFQLLDLATSNHQVLSFSKTSYATSSRIAEVLSEKGDFLSVTIAPVDTTQTFAASTATTVTDSAAASIAIPANAFNSSSGEAYTGNVTVSLTSFDPITDAGKSAFPGEFIGVTDVDDPSTTASPLLSYGYANITAVDADGNTLTLTGNATLTIPIPTTMQGSAPDTIDLWHYDATKGLWVKDGTAAKMGNNYVSTITSFSYRTDGLPFDPSFIKGKVTNCTTGEPLYGARIYISEYTANAWASEETTGSDGSYPDFEYYYYSGMTDWLGRPVYPGNGIELYAELNGIVSVTYTATAPAAGGLLVQDLCIYPIAGACTGTYSGVDSGSFGLTITENGLVTGSGTSDDPDVGDFSLSGYVEAAGYIRVGTVSIHNAWFQGTILTQAGTITGDWDSDVGVGTFSGTCPR